MITEEKVVEILKQCYDPEIPIDLWNLGLIYSIDIQDAFHEGKSEKNNMLAQTYCNNKWAKPGIHTFISYISRFPI